MPSLSIRKSRRMVVVAGLLAATVVHAAPPTRSATRAELVMATIARITIADGATNDAFEAGFAALRSVDAGMSLYRSESALVRLNARGAGDAKPVDADL